METPYIKFQFNTHKDKKFRGLVESHINLYPLVCMHLGSPQSDVRFLEAHLKRIAQDPNACWVYMGDGGECVTKLSKGDIYGQILSPKLQLEMCLDLLGPISAKGLFGIRGNHGHRIYKETGLDFDQQLCTRLGLPYLGVGAFANLTVNRSSYDAYFHHGIDSGIPLAAKVTKAEAFGRFINADAIFTAHSHVAMELQPSALLSCDNSAGKVVTRLRHQYICGSSYDSRTGYAEDKGYPPLLPSYLVVRFDGRISEGKARYSQTSTVFRSTGDYPLQHNYVEHYLHRDR